MVLFPYRGSSLDLVLQFDLKWAIPPHSGSQLLSDMVFDITQ